MASSSSDIQTMIDNIDTAIATLVASPEKMISYRIAEKTYNRKDAIDALIRLREYYHNILTTYPSEHIGEMDIDFTEFGEDETYYTDSGDES